MVPQSIPAWQLQSQRTIGVGDASTHNDGDKNDDNGSADGSGGSSETEVVTKHSDSSLELMYAIQFIFFFILIMIEHL